MTGKRAIFQATFSKAVPVVTRSTVQFVFEVPVEGGAADRALAALGGFPEAGKETWVAIARLDPKATTSDPDKPKFSLTQQAGIACNDQRFRSFLDEKYGPESDPFATAEEAAEAVRDLCHVKSRAEFDTDPAAGERWRKLYAEFQMEDKV